MIKDHSSKKTFTVNRLIFGLVFAGLLVACDPGPEDKLAADMECSQFAATKTGYTPANPQGGESSVGKGAVVGVVSGAALGAATGKKVVKGAAIGAAAGAGLGALKTNQDRKNAEQARSAYQAEYQYCMNQKGF